MNEHACELALAEVHDNPLQPRLAMNEEVIAGARATIESAGNRYPVSMAITVRPRAAGGYEIIAGHHRTRAARAAGLATVWAYVQLLDDRAAAIALAATNTQAEMSPLEHARHALWLAEHHGVTAAEYARLVGRSDATMSKSIAAYRVIESHGGPTGPNASVPVGALAALAGVADEAKRTALLYQFRTRRTTKDQATEVLAHLRAGVAMREAFRLVEEPDEEPASTTPKGAYDTAPRTGGAGNAASASDRAATAAVQISNELITAYEYTLSLYQARSEELESRVGALTGADHDAFVSAVAARQARILRELRAAPAAKLLKPRDISIACASCAHGKASTFSDTGWMCQVQRAAMCQPLTHRKCWVDRDESEA